MSKFFTLVRIKGLNSLHWLFSNPWIIAAFAGGAIFGAVTSLQMFDIQLTEGSGDLLGAALGAALALGGGAWLARYGEREVRLHTIDSVNELLSGTNRALESLLTSYYEVKREPENYNGDVFALAADTLQSAAEETRRDIERVRPAILAMGMSGAVLHMKLEKLLDAALQIAFTAREYSGLGKDFKGATAYVNRISLEAWKSELRNILGFIK